MVLGTSLGMRNWYLYRNGSDIREGNVVIDEQNAKKT